ncbi:darcynin family protein [uncultured Arcticibacterium sp.]|uniref:darcynin family protein n=1 Tax=uncultured Arcticibacterium sp. TaxID=2173042 RepID=UPI0030F6E904
MKKKYTVLILYRATHLWLGLTREERSIIFDKELAPLLTKYNKSLNVRFFDSEAFHAHTSDFIIVETADLNQYYYFMEHLRDTSLFGKPYIELNNIIMGLEDGFKDFESNEIK